MLTKLAALMPCDSDCTGFLASKGLSPEDLLTDILKYGLFGHADISRNGDRNIISAVSGGVEGQAITVNNQGAFFLGQADGGDLTVGPRQIPGGTPRAQGFILLHELGHNTGALQPDASVPSVERQNDEEIQQHCKKTIDSLAQ